MPAALVQRVREAGRRGMTTIVAIFLMMIFSVLCLMCGSVTGTGSEQARSVLRSKQAFYLSDSALMIGKQLVLDNGNNFRPWNGSSYSCPTNWTGAADDSDTHYCYGTMTVGGLTATLRVYVCKDGTTTGDSANPCTDATTNDDFEILGFGKLSGE